MVTPSFYGVDGKLSQTEEWKCKWMTQKSITDSFVELVPCNCRKFQCSNKAYAFKTYCLTCIDICNCTNCCSEAVEKERYSDDENDSDSEFSD